LAGVPDVGRLAETHDAVQGVGVVSERRPSSQQDEIEWSVLVLISKLDRRLTNTRRGVVVTANVAVSRPAQPTTFYHCSANLHFFLF